MSIKGPKCARAAEARAAGTVSEPADGPASSLSSRAPFNQVPPEKRDQDGDEWGALMVSPYRLTGSSRMVPSAGLTAQERSSAVDKSESVRPG